MLGDIIKQKGRYSMDKKEIIVIWVVGIALALGFVLSTYKISYYKESISALDQLEEIDKSGDYQKPAVPTGEWHIRKTHSPYVIFSNLITYIPTILILGTLSIYTLRKKKRK
jgi:uncharacterized membrane protein YecN with MAPEG domain